MRDKERGSMAQRIQNRMCYRKGKKTKKCQKVGFQVQLLSRWASALALGLRLLLVSGK